jgi:hypothetical protein
MQAERCAPPIAEIAGAAAAATRLLRTKVEPALAPAGETAETKNQLGTVHFWWRLIRPRHKGVQATSLDICSLSRNTAVR